ncbi:MAG TPA: hypothetical protein VIB00_15060 [Pyrinomonadaceae bacterium]|jgi:hypothetical protein
MIDQTRTNELGGATLKFVIVMAIIGAIAFAGYKFVPVAYQSYLFKDLMQHNVDVAATQGYQPQWVRDQLFKSLPEYNIPQTAMITPVARDNRIEVTVQYTLPIEFPGYTYQYEFDHTARSTAFLSFK